MRESARSMDRLPILIDKTIGMKLFFGICAQILCIILLPITPYALNIKLIIILYSFYLLFQSFLGHWIIVFTVHEKFYYRAILNVFPQLIYLVSAVYIVYSIENQNYQVIFLVIANLLSVALTLILCYLFAQKVIKFKSSLFEFNFDKKIIIGGSYFLIITLAGLLFAKIDIFMVSILGDEQQVAIFNVASRLTRQLSEIRTVMYAGFFPILIKRTSISILNKGVIYKTTLFFFICTLIGAFIMQQYSVDIFLLLYGNKYAYSGYLFGLLCYFLAIDYSIQPYVMLLTSSGNEKIVAIIFSLLAIINIVTNVIFYNYWNLAGIVYSTLLTYTIFAILIVVVGVPILKKNNIIA